jgi:hypothetical protein
MRLTPGRRRFVTLVQNLGSPAQQLAVIEQTASWAIRHDFPIPIDESLAVLQLGNTANDLQATFRLEPMIQAYLQSDSLVLEILHAAIWPARRMKIPELSRCLIHGVMSVVHAKGGVAGTAQGSGAKGGRTCHAQSR